MIEDYDDGNGGVPREEVNLHDIIKEGKSERKIKAEEKRMMDLNRIRDMKSSTGIDPLQRFPKEIWAKIFDELGPADKGNVWQVHPMFRDLLENNRIRDILFPMVLKVDAFEHYVKNRNGRNGISCIFNYARLRQVSKSIMKSFDRLVEEKLLKRIEESETCYLEFLGVVSIDLSSSKEREMLKRLLASFKDSQDHPGKHFFPKDLYIFWDLDFENEVGQDFPELVDDFRSNLIALLEVIGDQILHFRFLFAQDYAVQFSTSGVYILFQQLVTFMPNLKWLEVDIHPRVISRNDKEATDLILQNHPFPRLASLERLSCHYPFYEGSKREAFPFYQTVIEANLHLKMLDLVEMNDNGFGAVRDDLIKSLPLTCFRPYSPYSSSVDLFGVATLENVQQIVNFDWFLSKIHLHLDHSETDATASMSSLFRFLERFPTLETVKLNRLSGFIITRDDVFEYLQLPSLKNFELVLYKPQIRHEGNVHFFLSLQFLLYCKNLKALKWKIIMRLEDDVNELRKYLKDHENGDSVDFRAGLTFLYGSNIWNVFPSLDTVKVDILIPVDENYRVNVVRHSCKHKYRRGAFSDFGRMSVKRFLKSHHGCGSKNLLQYCVILHK